MGFLKEIIESLFQSSGISECGNPDLWLEAKRKNDKQQIEKYELNIKALIDRGIAAKSTYGAFLIGVGRKQEGKKYLEESLKDKEEGSENNYVTTLNYYLSTKNDNNNDSWIEDLIQQAEKNIELEIDNSYVFLAVSYEKYFDLTDESTATKEKIIKIEDLYLKAIEKKEALVFDSYADYLFNITTRDNYKKLFPKNINKWMESKDYYLKSLKEEKKELSLFNGEQYIYSNLIRYSYIQYNSIKEDILKKFFLDDYNIFINLKENEKNFNEARKYLDKYKKINRENTTNEILFRTFVASNDQYAILNQMKFEYNNFVKKYLKEIEKENVSSVEIIKYEYEIENYYYENESLIFDGVDYSISEEFLERAIKRKGKREQYLASNNRIDCF